MLLKRELKEKGFMTLFVTTKLGLCKVSFLDHINKGGAANSERN